MKQENETIGVPVSHYLILCSLSLAAVFLAQVQQGLVLGNLLAIAWGVLGIVGRIRLAPIVFLLLVAANQVIEGDLFYGLRFRSIFRPRWLDLGDLLLCIGVLGYLATHYRLQGIWYRVLSADPRRRLEPTRRKFLGIGPTPFADPQRRLPEKMQPREISLMLLSLPVWAMLAQVLAAALAPSWRFFELPGWLARILFVVWSLAAGAFLITNLLDVWKRRFMSREAAAIYLQDVCWRETRGEQRRVERWLAWKRTR